MESPAIKTLSLKTLQDPRVEALIAENKEMKDQLTKFITERKDKREVSTISVMQQSVLL